jgi:TonB family protein
MMDAMMLVLGAAATAAPVPASDPASWAPEQRQKIEKVLSRASVGTRRPRIHEQDAQRASGGPVVLKEGVLQFPRYRIDEDVYGCVVVSFEILPDGKTDQFEVVRADPPGIFDEAAMRLMLVTEFEKPAPVAAGAARPRHPRSVFVLMPQSLRTEYTSMNQRDEDERDKARAGLRAACETPAS